MKRIGVGLTAAALAVLGCTAQTPGTGNISVTPTNAQSTARTFDVMVTAPKVLGTDGKIVSADVAGIIAAGGGNIIAAGGGNVIAPGGGNYVLLADAGASGAATATLKTAAAYTMVQQAGVVLETLKGQRLSAKGTTDDQGTVRLKGVRDGEPLFAVALFKVGEKLYRVSTPVPPGKIAGTLMADPINTIVAARVRELLANNGKGSAVSEAEVSEVWTIINDSGLEVPLDALQADASLTTLVGIYKTAIASDKISAEKRKVIQAYMAKLQGS